MAVRVRFAPSPTGHLHLGGARTALYSWLWARRHGGAFVLRIEDTDRARSTETSIAVVLDSMRWLGLDWDEGPEVGGDHGPYFQTQRLDIYAEHAARLVDAGHAYRCYATKEDIAEQRAAHEARTGKSHGFRFQSPWRDRAEASDRPHVVRWRAPSAGTTGWTDLVKGPIAVPNDTQQDAVLVRTDGVPLYNFGAVVDDLTMGITLIARGDDHMVNTPIQLLLYEGLGERPPEFAHLPMILGPDGQKLSKRHAAVGVLEYRERGYLPDAVLNYLARLGWSHGDQEIFTRDELTQAFDWKHVGATGARYDADKFSYVQAAHLRAMPSDEVAALAAPFLAARNLTVAANDARLAKAIDYVKPRVTSLAEVADHVDYFFRDEPVMEDKGRRKFLKPEHAERLRSLAEAIEHVSPFDGAALEACVQAWMEREELTMKHFAQSARVAMTGRTRSPGLYEVMEVLGKDTTLARLRRGADLAAESEA